MQQRAFIKTKAYLTRIINQLASTKTKERERKHELVMLGMKKGINYKEKASPLLKNNYQ